MQIKRSFVLQAFYPSGGKNMVAAQNNLYGVGTAAERQKSLLLPYVHICNCRRFYRSPECR